MLPSSEQPILPRLAAFVSSFRSRKLAAEALHGAARALVDWTAVTIPGGVQPPATLLASALGDEWGAGGASLVPSGRRLAARAAALINGSAAHTIEFDDIYRDALYHPGAPTIAAALAIAQERHASGELFLRAVIAGYELSTRIGVVVQPMHYHFWHTTGTVGTFGAAAAVATVLGLDPERCAHALATSATLAAGLQQAFRSHSMSKPLHSGHAAETGLLAAIAAERGVTGASDILEGPRGFGAAMSSSPDFSRTLAAPDAYNIGAITFKNYSACGHTFAPIDAARELRSRYALAGPGIDDIQDIEIATYAKALEVAGNLSPRTAFEARFSLPYCVAVVLVTGSARLEAFADERLHDPRVRALMEKTVLRVDAQADAAYPTQRAGKVTLRLRTRGTVSFLAPTRKGDPDNPLSDEELSDKFLELASPIIGSEPARRLLEVLWGVGVLPDLAQLPLPPLTSTTRGGAT